MNADELNTWRKLTNEASPGPWTFEDGHSGDNWMIGTLVTGNHDNKDYSVSITTDHLHASQYTHGNALTDAAFIAAAREAMPALIAEVRLLQVENARLRAELAERERDTLCSVCGHLFTSFEWVERHTAPDGSDIHADCCQECNHA